MIEFTNVVKAYNTGNKALKGISMHMDDGEFVFLVGPSGSGKSTIIKLITGEIQPTEGSVLVNNFRLESIRSREIPYLRRTVGVVFQDFRLIPNKTVYENVAFAQRVILLPFRIIRKRVPEVLTLVGLAEKYKSKPDQLSGGEQQRVALARALVNRPSILLADEPTGALDSHSSQMLLSTIQSIHEELGTTILMVTHDAFTASYASRILFLQDGKIFTELNRGSDSRSAFFEKILHVLTLLGGGESHVC